MTKIKANVKEAAGYVEEETGELVGSDKTATKGRQLRNEGRMEKGKAPKLTKPGHSSEGEENEGEEE